MPSLWVGTNVSSTCCVAPCLTAGGGEEPLDMGETASPQPFPITLDSSSSSIDSAEWAANRLSCVPWGELARRPSPCRCCCLHRSMTCAGESSP
ncbi:hypothetical protein AGDE_15380 [Angomonas deanei]|uniref:Uncharacterized protein n=1 Tax=Angomonas deanei TaxID=59799 RepID=A0A7G2CGG4_9TRYP|nr:hypothetical protein AGDE_15380 [Angomonas deanei]CAD2217783.1 hypothetical protein, conserved [Angomonas deanei]|eukprot:EPY19183.1 hypothetical protein AGDE_15380 [Angomonas deanei]